MSIALPFSWEIKNLWDKKYFTLIMGQSPKSDTYNKNQEWLPFFQWKKEFWDISPIPEQWCSQPLKIAESWDILLSVRAPVWPTNVANQTCGIWRGLSAIRVNSQYGLNNYILYFFKKFQQEISSLWKGSTFNAITKKDLENLQIPLPPLDEQKRIVAKLDEVSASIGANQSAIRQQIEDLDNLWASRLSDAFDGDWIVETLWNKDILEIIDWDRWKNYPKKIDFSPEWYCLFLNTSNVRKWCRNFDKMDFITKERDELLRQWKVKKGDVIVTTRWTIANCAYVYDDFDFDQIRINSWMIIARTNQNKLFPWYLLKLILSPSFMDQVVSKISWSAQPQLPIRIMKSIQIPLPPLETQKAIVKELDALHQEISDLKKGYETQLEEYDALWASVLDKAFQGELV